MKTTIQLKELSKLGYTDPVARSLAITIISKHCKFEPKENVLKTLSAILHDPAGWKNNPVWNKLASHLFPDEKEVVFTEYILRDEPSAAVSKTYGGKFIDTNAKQQLLTALRLPVTLQGALMPDAHGGYGLPIGGVLAVNNAVIPYAVGMDIGCRMSLSIFDANEKYIQRYAYQLKEALSNYTHFGMDGSVAYTADHEVLQREEFRYTELLRSLRGKAARQLGSSGSGNHFVEFGEIELYADNLFYLPPGKYMALLTHSGSRGLGAAIARQYTDIAMDTCVLPREAKNLAWLSLDSEAGQEYWLSMTLAGDYARACHDCIHENIRKSLGLETLLRIENHHNFAWKETLADGTPAIIHRKGATPAHQGIAGIIPGSMTTPGYLVTGRGEPLSLNSASHGSGRAMSREKARNTITNSGLKKTLAQAGVTLIGGSTEEAPLAYKDIETVMRAQQDLVKVEGRFIPKIVRMNKE